MKNLSFLDRLSDIQENIKKAQMKSDLAASHINIVAVVKRQSLEKIEEALKAGHRVFGENRLQEALERWPGLKKEYPDTNLHYIGHLQSNKVSQIVSLFDVIETVDRLSVAEALSKELMNKPKKITCYIQVNTGMEDQKSGIAPNEANEFISFCKHDLELPVKGLMCIPPVDEAPSIHFAFLRDLATAHKLDHLSMGMSADYQEAVMFGATHIRIGTSLFGERLV